MLDKIMKYKIIGGVVLSAVVVTGTAIGIARARYLSQIGGSGTGQIANMICETKVTTYGENEEPVHPYCQLDVNNFNDNNETTGTSLDYTIKITVDEGETLPDYYCTDSNGNIVADTRNNNPNITGSLGCLQKETDTYTVYFINLGENTYLQDLHFETEAIQQK